MIVLRSWKGRSFNESLKALEADIQLANTLALCFPNEKEGTRFQMRLNYGPAAHFLLFFISWTDCRLAGTLGLLHILIYKVMKDGITSMSVSERKASLGEFYGFILPSLCVLGSIPGHASQQQHSRCAEKDQKQFNVCMEGHVTQIDIEREHECGICLEIVPKVVLPGCHHSMCLRCYREWRTKSLSCPFCRSSLKNVKSRDLWVYVDYSDVLDMETLMKDNCKMLFMYIEKLPLVTTKGHYDMKEKRHL